MGVSSDSMLSDASFQPKPIDIQRLQIQDNRLTLSKKSSSGPTSDASSSTQEEDSASQLEPLDQSLSPKLLKALDVLLTPTATQIIFTNKGTSKDPNTGYFALVITHKSVNLLIRKSVKVSKYSFNYKRRELQLNGVVKDSSFRRSFFDAVRKVIPMIRSGMVNVEVK